MSACDNCKFKLWCADYEDKPIWCIDKSHLNIAYNQGRADAIEEISGAMYHQCFECNNEGVQKWDGVNWFRYKTFENVLEQLKENNET